MKVCVLGAGGFIGKNLLHNTNWVGVTRDILNLENQNDVETYFNAHSYDVVVHCGVVGGSRLKKDAGDVVWKNILMFENVVRVFKGKLVYFSSGAALCGDPPTEPYGLSKWIIDKRIYTISNAYSVRIWGCYGPGELPTRFSAICKNNGHVIIPQDRYFDFIDVADVKEIVHGYVYNKWLMPKYCNLVYPDVKLLSEWAEIFGATWEVTDTSSLGESYAFKRNHF